MADSAFIAAFNLGNTAFGVSCAEEFTVILHGNPGTYSADSIDNLEILSTVKPGGFANESTVVLWVSDAVFASAGIVDGMVVSVRGKRLRVISTQKDGDNCRMVQCGPAGMSL